MRVQKHDGRSTRVTPNARRAQCSGRTWVPPRHAAHHSACTKHAPARREFTSTSAATKPPGEHSTVSSERLQQHQPPADTAFVTQVQQGKARGDQRTSMVFKCPGRPTSRMPSSPVGTASCSWVCAVACMVGKAEVVAWAGHACTRQPGSQMEPSHVWRHAHICLRCPPIHPPRSPTRGKPPPTRPRLQARGCRSGSARQLATRLLPPAWRRGGPRIRTRHRAAASPPAWEVQGRVHMDAAISRAWPGALVIKLPSHPKFSIKAMAARRPHMQPPASCCIPHSTHLLRRSSPGAGAALRLRSVASRSTPPVRCRLLGAAPPAAASFSSFSFSPPPWCGPAPASAAAASSSRCWQPSGSTRCRRSSSSVRCSLSPSSYLGAGGGRRGSQSVSNRSTAGGARRCISGRSTAPPAAGLT